MIFPCTLENEHYTFSPLFASFIRDWVLHLQEWTEYSVVDRPVKKNPSDTYNHGISTDTYNHGISTGTEYRNRDNYSLPRVASAPEYNNFRLTQYVLALSAVLTRCEYELTDALTLSKKRIQTHGRAGATLFREFHSALTLYVQNLNTLIHSSNSRQSCQKIHMEDLDSSCSWFSPSASAMLHVHSSRTLVAAAITRVEQLMADLGILDSNSENFVGGKIRTESNQHELQLQFQLELQLETFTHTVIHGRQYDRDDFEGVKSRFSTFNNPVALTAPAIHVLLECSSAEEPIVAVYISNMIMRITRSTSDFIGE